MKMITTLALSTLIITGCTSNNRKTEETHNYHEIRENIIAWNDVFLQDSNDYLVYFYSERCGHCNEIKQDVLSFYFKHLIDMYFVCTDIEVVFGQYKDLTGIDCIDDFYIFGTPFLTRLSENKISDYHVGSNAIKEYVNQFK